MQNIIHAFSGATPQHWRMSLQRVSDFIRIGQVTVWDAHSLDDVLKTALMLSVGREAVIASDAPQRFAKVLIAHQQGWFESLRQEISEDVKAIARHARIRHAQYRERLFVSSDAVSLEQTLDRFTRAIRVVGANVVFLILHGSNPISSFGDPKEELEDDIWAYQTLAARLNIALVLITSTDSDNPSMEVRYSG